VFVGIIWKIKTSVGLYLFQVYISPVIQSYQSFMMIIIKSEL